MCGRCCLTLGPCQIQEACKYKDEQEKKDILPLYRSEYNLGRKYESSYNIAPSDITPVLVSADHFEETILNDAAEQKNYCHRCLVPMLWGMIPFWHKGDYKKHGLTTNNCRLEHMLESKLYSGPFQKGQRCVVLCEGFYEWQTTQSAKPSGRAAYYIHMPQKVDIKIYDKTTWGTENLNLNLLKLAGLFDTWKDDNGDIIYSYSIITFESDKVLSWLHHRTPAILESEQQVADWLDFKRIPYKKALTVIKPPSQITWHRVSNLVNNARNKHENCNKPIALNKGDKTNLLKSWLIVRKRKEEKLKEEASSSDTADEFENSDDDNENDIIRIKRRKNDND